MSDADREIADIRAAFGMLAELIGSVSEQSLDRDVKLAEASAKLTKATVETGDSVLEIRKAILRLDERIRGLENFVAFRRMLKPDNPDA